MLAILMGIIVSKSVSPSVKFKQGGHWPDYGEGEGQYYVHMFLAIIWINVLKHMPYI